MISMDFFKFPGGFATLVQSGSGQGTSGKENTENTENEENESKCSAPCLCGTSQKLDTIYAKNEN